MEKEFQEDKGNQYLEMLRFMKLRKKIEQDQESTVGKKEYQQAIKDFQREQEDVVAVKEAGFARFESGDGGKTTVRFKRPPRSSKEAISALKEADRRY